MFTRLFCFFLPWFGLGSSPNYRLHKRISRREREKRPSPWEKNNCGLWRSLQCEAQRATLEEGEQQGGATNFTEAFLLSAHFLQKTPWFSRTLEISEKDLPTGLANVRCFHYRIDRNTQFAGGLWQMYGTFLFFGTKLYRGNFLHPFCVP